MGNDTNEGGWHGRQKMEMKKRRESEESVPLWTPETTDLFTSIFFIFCAVILILITLEVSL